MATDLSELEKLADARKKEALENDLFNKVKAIIKELGSNNPPGGYTTPHRTLSINDLEITYSDIYPEYSETEEERSEICYKNQCAFNGYKKFWTRSLLSSAEKEMTIETISAYNPSIGNWTEEVDLLYEQVQKIQKDRAEDEARKSKEQKARDLKDNFGI